MRVLRTKVACGVMAEIDRVSMQNEAVRKIEITMIMKFSINKFIERISQ